jgi:hypothetical protein
MLSAGKVVPILWIGYTPAIPFFRRAAVRTKKHPHPQPYNTRPLRFDKRVVFHLPAALVAHIEKVAGARLETSSAFYRRAVLAALESADRVGPSSPWPPPTEREIAA